MSQTQVPTTEGFVELAKLFAGTAATAAKSIVNIKTSITVNAAQTYAGITKCTEDGLAIANGTVTLEETTVVGDTVQVTKEFTTGVGISVTVLGFGVCNDDDDVLYMICGYNAGQPLEAGDKITNTGKMQVKIGAA
jgi:hypothetical protein